jgi:hypothetical protein
MRPKQPILVRLLFLVHYDKRQRKDLDYMIMIMRDSRAFQPETANPAGARNHATRIFKRYDTAMDVSRR